jgi:hypothetical protein
MSSYVYRLKQETKSFSIDPGIEKFKISHVKHKAHGWQHHCILKQKSPVSGAFYNF